MSGATLQQVLKTLVDARALLSKRGAWTKYLMAKNKDGRGVPPDSKKAISFCAMGAVLSITKRAVIRFEAIDRLELQVPVQFQTATREGLGRFNDTRKTKRPIIALYDRAIKKLRKDIRAKRKKP